MTKQNAIQLKSPEACPFMLEADDFFKSYRPGFMCWVHFKYTGRFKKCDELNHFPKWCPLKNGVTCKEEI